MKTVIWTLVAVAAAALFVVQQRKIAALRASVDQSYAQVAEARAEAQRAGEAAKPDPSQVDRAEQERAELLRLRAEVSALRQEKAAWEKKTASDRAAAQSAALTEANQKQAQTAQGMQWVETVMAAPAGTKGVESGNLRRKFLNHEQLTEAEQALLLNMMNKSGDIEKSPEEFAAFQSAFIGSLLSWTNDPRMEQVQATLMAASKVANQRGFDYHAPGENADKWNEGQKALNERATGAVQKLLTPDERAIFDKALIGALGIDFGVGPTR